MLMLLPGDIKAPDFQYFFDHAQTPFMLLKGKDFIYTYVNEAYHKFSEGRDIIGKPFDEVMPHLKNTPVKALLENGFQTGTPLQVQEFPVTTTFDKEQTSTRYFDFSFTPYQNKDGKVEGILASSIDVTDTVALRHKEDRYNFHQQAY